MCKEMMTTAVDVFEISTTKDVVNYVRTNGRRGTVVLDHNLSFDECEQAINRHIESEERWKLRERTKDIHHSHEVLETAVQLDPRNFHVDSAAHFADHYNNIVEEDESVVAWMSNVIEPAKQWLEDCGYYITTGKEFVLGDSTMSSAFEPNLARDLDLTGGWNLDHLEYLFSYVGYSSDGELEIDDWNMGFMLKVLEEEFNLKLRDDTMESFLEDNDRRVVMEVIAREYLVDIDNGYGFQTIYVKNN